MFLVRLKDNSKHSIWNTEIEAIKQIKILKNYGYRHCYYEEIETEEYLNGHYFI